MSHQPTETNNSDPQPAAPQGQGPDAHQYPPNATQAQQDQAAQGESNFSDGSGALFSMYLDRTEEEDRRMAESWKGDADGMLVFTGLFSAAVAALLAVTIPYLQPNPQDTTAYYVANIFEQISKSNGINVTIPTSLSNPAESFTPSSSAFWVNLLWFLSLVISLTCALLATLLQQWARRYLRIAYPRYSPHKRARVRAFYAHGVEKLHLPWTVAALPALLHISLFLFFAGVAVFLFGVNFTIFKVVIVWVGLCVILYSYLTLLPILHKNSPYSAPLSTLVSFCLTGMRSTFFRLVERSPRLAPHILMLFNHRDANAVHLTNFFSHSMSKTAEQFAFKLGPDIDYESLLWTFQSLDEDAELEQFFEGLPGLFSSKVVANVPGFIKKHERELSSALIELMNRTLSSNLISESVKRRRIIICTKAVDATSLLGAWWILCHVLLGDWQKFLGSIEFGLFVQKWKSSPHKVTAFFAQCVATATISTVRDRDDRWFQLATSPLNTSIYIDCVPGNANTILLANAIVIVRQTIQTFSGSAPRHRCEIIRASSETLKSVCKFDVHRTLLDFQHEFCTLWNQLVDLAQNDDRPHIVCVAKTTLKNIRKLYITMHKGTSASPLAFSNATDDEDSVLDDPKSYCECTIAEHRPSLSLQVPELIIEDPPPEGAGNTPDVTMHPHFNFPLPPPTFPMPPPHPGALVLAPAPPPFPLPTHHRGNLQSVFVPPAAFPTPQVPPIASASAPPIARAANVGTHSTTSIAINSSSSSSSLDPIGPSISHIRSSQTP